MGILHHSLNSLFTRCPRVASCRQAPGARGRNVFPVLMGLYHLSIFFLRGEQVKEREAQNKISPSRNQEVKRKLRGKNYICSLCARGYIWDFCQPTYLF
jgi:hypothetical protein